MHPAGVALTSGCTELSALKPSIFYRHNCWDTENKKNLLCSPEWKLFFSCPSVPSSSKDKLMKAKSQKTVISKEYFCREFSYSKMKKSNSRSFSSQKGGTVEKRAFLLKIMLLTENFSTENQCQQDPFQTAHILGQHLLFPPLRSPWSEGTVVARSGCAGEMELLLIPSSHSKNSEQGHMQRGCSGALGDALSLCCLS